MSETGVTVAVFTSHEDAEAALKRLRAAGIGFENISLVGRDYQTEEKPLGYFNMGDRVVFFGKLGAFWGTLAGALFGAFVLVIPVFGHIIILGPLAATIVSALEGTVVGGAAGALGGALTGIGIPKDSAIRYATAAHSGQFLLTVTGSAEELRLADGLLRETAASDVETHGQPAREPAPAG